MIAAKKIVVLYGGTSAEREVSLNSGQAVANGLKQAGFEVLLHDTRDIALSTLSAQNIDCVFIALHGRGGEDGCVQGALEYLGIPYTGSGVLGSALSMDKIRSKQIWQAMDLPTAPFLIAKKQDFNELNITDANVTQLKVNHLKVNQILTQLNGKVMVKPANEGSSIGMAKAENAEQLSQALTEAFGFDDEVLVEAWIEGPEYTVAILGQEALPVIHMETPREFYDYKAKYQSNSTQYHCPCHLSQTDETALQALAVEAFNATGAQGWGRVDVMRNANGQWQLLEINTVPGMTETSLVPKAAKVHGLDFSQLVTQIVELSCCLRNKKISEH